MQRRCVAFLVRETGVDAATSVSAEESRVLSRWAESFDSTARAFRVWGSLGKVCKAKAVVQWIPASKSVHVDSMECHRAMSQKLPQACSSRSSLSGASGHSSAPQRNRALQPHRNETLQPHRAMTMKVFGASLYPLLRPHCKLPETKRPKSKSLAAWKARRKRDSPPMAKPLPYSWILQTGLVLLLAKINTYSLAALGSSAVAFGFLLEAPRAASLGAPRAAERFRCRLSAHRLTFR